MKGTPDVFHELDKVIANYIGNPYCEIAIIVACSPSTDRVTKCHRGEKITWPDTESPNVTGAEK